jgi:HTH-type transcriptional regulator / antitoxin HigA
MKPKIRNQFPDDAPETYEDLARLYVPRRIIDEIGRQTATEFIDWLSVRAQNKDQIEFLDFVSDLLGEYEDQFEIEKPAKVPFGFVLLGYLVTENGITTRELGKILGVDHSVAARILTGDRSITVQHAKHLGDHFKVDPGLFLGLQSRG